MMRDYPLRSGKRLRPALCLLICEAFGGNPQEAFNTAAALEILQDWLLIHDDIEDDSDLRRGQPCLHQKHGIPMAINVGDALHCKMWEMLHQNADLLGYELAFRILSEFTRLSNQVVEGQHIELSWVSNNRWNLTEADYWTMCVQKTAWYTCITPCRVGALIAGVTKAEANQFDDIGMNLGVAFQIQDDVLNLVGEVGRYGKEIAGDISEGKRTLVLIHLFSSCTKVEALRVIEIMDKPREDKNQDEIEEVLHLMGKYKSIQYAQQQSKKLAQTAYTQFNHEFAHLPDSRAKNLFLRLIHFVIEREY
jgi:geranylgeranyl diphosphate synthase type II